MNGKQSIKSFTRELIENYNHSTNCSESSRSDIIRYSKYKRDGLLQVNDGVICPLCKNILRNTLIFSSHLKTVHKMEGRITKNNGLVYLN